MEQLDSDFSCCLEQQQASLHLNRLRRMQSPVTESAEISQCRDQPVLASGKPGTSAVVPSAAYARLHNKCLAHISLRMRLP